MQQRNNITGRIRPRGVLDWLCGGRADYRAFQRRRKTGAYRKRLQLCKSFWIAAGIAIIVHPTLTFAVTVALTTTFLCFAFLDES